jgi:EAL domain-containing protein (putative c-di-GMP-specific phosphodiesterase class I)/GGDEF domain-containing protein
MSLHKQLWVAVFVLLALLLGFSLVIGGLSSKSYMERQLASQNADSARALAPTVARLIADGAPIEPSLQAQFDSGAYELIRYTDPAGRSPISLQDDQPQGNVPAWFAGLIALDVAPGVAPVGDASGTMGKLTVSNHSRGAYRALWSGAKNLSLGFIAIAVLAGLIGSLLLKSGLKPLKSLSEQARAIGQNKFTQVDEPSTLELRELVDSMNALSKRVKTMQTKDAAKADKLSKNSQVDGVSGLLKREQFVRRLTEEIERKKENGVLSMIRLRGLAQLNQIYGRKVVDGMLTDLGKALNTLVMQKNDWSGGRMNGSDFAILAPKETDARAVAEMAQKAVLEVLENRQMERGVSVPAASIGYVRGDKVTTILTGLDGVLLSADKQGESTVQVAGHDDIQIMPVRERLQSWREIFGSAFSNQQFFLSAFPVIDREGSLLHHESRVRLEYEGEELSARQLLPWINRLDLAVDLDKHVVELAVRYIEQQGGSLAIHLSSAALADSSFVLWIGEQLSAHDSAARKLWIEVPEKAAYRYSQNFEKLANRIHTHGVKVGIDHFGRHLTDLGRLNGKGIDYLKIDASLVNDLDANPANQVLVRTLSDIGQSLEMAVIAEGVSTEAEWHKALELGIHGGMGPWVIENGLKS